MTIEEIKRRKEELGYSAEQLSELSGVPLGTLQKILAGQTKVPRYATRIAIEKALGLQSEGRLFDGNKETLSVKEDIAFGKKDREKKQGEYTVEDYRAWPEDDRVELIDGYITKMDSPSYIHQRFTLHLAYRAQSFIEANKGDCLVMISPLSVRLDCDDKTMLQPDALILCDRSKIRKWGIDGAPDFMLEVLSDSSRKKDLSLKMKKYCVAGVREYWIIDPKKKMLYVYDFSEEGVPGVYPLEGEVGVGIFDGRLRINLNELAEMYADIEE